MRKILAVLLAGLFLILFFVATTVNQVVDTASDPGVITGMLDDADAYDYVYDNIVGNLVHDMVDKGIEVNSGLDDTAAPTVLNFDDPDAAALAITNLIETLVPREYVQEKLEESLNGVVPYAKGETDEFTIDLEVQERVRQVLTAVREVVEDLDLSERIIEDLLVPQLDQFSDQVSTQALGIELTDAEIEAAVREIFEPVWLEGQLFAAIDEITPFFAGDADSFNVVLKFDDRAVVIGRILKDKLVKDDTLYNLVFNQVVDPLIEQTVAQSTSVGFGISLTEAEVVSTFEVIAPRDWVQEQGEGVIDALIDYLVGKSDELSYTVDLSDRKVTATEELQELALSKLAGTLEAIPACTTPAEVLGMSQDISSQQLPRCVAGGQATIDLALNSFSSVMDTQVANFVAQQVPSEVSYSQADLEAQLGGQLDTIDDMRERIIEGVSFTDQDLIDSMSDGSRESRADAEEALRILADGVMFTEANIIENLDPLALRQFNNIREYAGTALSLKWFLWVLVLIPLMVIALIGGNGWAGRLKWAGGVAAVSGLIVYGGIAVAWSFNDIAQDYVPDYGAEVSSEFRADYPRLSAELESDELNNRFERAMDSWQQSWRNQTVPWIIAGAVAFMAGTAMAMANRTKGTPLGGGTAYKGSAPRVTSSSVRSIPKEWGDGDDGDAADEPTTTDKPEATGDQKEPDSEAKT
ncbi:MAG: hypothetical protein HOE43_05335 [Chloroflexi bacterium]|jgi:hypothetical protein|nr:hypothetical protein [Chloroflexota bacterium]